MGPEGAKRRASAKEHDIGIEVRTAFLEVVHDGIADLLGQRQACLTASLATYTDRGFSSPRRRWTISPARSPRRARRSRIARSRLPTGVDGPQEAITRSTSSSRMYRGREESRQ
jgi:hypothetical protein